MRFHCETICADEFGRSGTAERSGADQASECIVNQDLPDCLSDPELARLVEKTVSERAIADSAPLTEADRILLGIITYSYAKGTYFSDEIESALLKTAGGQIFDSSPSQVIRRFRRNHRQLVERCLGSVLYDAAARCGRCGPGFPSNSFSKEASDRVQRAVQYDSWALDF